MRMFVFLRVISPKSHFKIWQKSLEDFALHLPEAATVHSSPVAADFGERVLRCSYGVIRVKTRVAIYGILLHPD